MERDMESSRALLSSGAPVTGEGQLWTSVDVDIRDLTPPNTQLSISARDREERKERTEGTLPVTISTFSHIDRRELITCICIYAIVHIVSLLFRSYNSQILRLAD
jgi:hypothetical protein